jgi:hypothetical protein
MKDNVRAERPLHFALLDDGTETGRDFSAVLPHTTALHETILRTSIASVPSSVPVGAARTTETLMLRAVRR